MILVAADSKVDITITEDDLAKQVTEHSIYEWQSPPPGPGLKPITAL